MQGCGYGAGVSVYGRVKVIFFRKRVKDLSKFWQIYIFLYICRPNIPNTMFRTHPRGPIEGRARRARRAGGGGRQDNTNGLMAEWLGKGLQNLIQRFESASDLTKTALEITLTLFFFSFVIHL